MSEWIKVCGEEGGNPIEVETEDGNEIFYLVHINDLKPFKDCHIPQVSFF